MKIFKSIDLLLEKICHYGLIISVFFMLTLTVLSIVLRWFNTTFMWIDPLVRHLVFLATFMGGALATGKNEHIGIDIVPKILETKKMFRTQKTIRSIIYLVCVFGSLWLMKSGLDFFKVEGEYGSHTFFNLHSSVLVFIIPLGFSLMAYRFFYQFLLSTCSCSESKEVA